MAGRFAPSGISFTRFKQERKTVSRFRSSVLFASVGASFVLGFGAAWLLKPEPAAADAGAVALQAPPGRAAESPRFGDALAMPGSAPAARAAPLPANAGVDELWTRALAPQDPQQPGYDAEDRLRKLVQIDPAAMRKLLQRYDTDRTPQGRELLKSVLSTVQTPDAIGFSTRLAGSMNAAERKYGFELLQNLAPDAPETRALVKRTLAGEQSADVLVQALATLKSSASDPEEAGQMVAQLKTLSLHADPAVRSASISQLAQWDKKGEGAERLSQALADKAPEVRQAAVFAIAQSGFRTDEYKAALMAVVNNPQESKDLRGSAMQALERFSLSKEEYASFAQARARMQ